MKKFHQRLAAFAAGALLLSLCAGSLPAFAAEAGGDTVHIGSAADFSAFAESCTLDTYSQGKTVYLDADVNLALADMREVPTFGGIFEGGSHTISGLAVTDGGAVRGVFRYLQKGALLREVNVRGTVLPGEEDTLGGIAGQNSGTIELCSFEGTVGGMNKIGGIAGENTESGILRSCRVSGSVYGEHFVGGIAGSNAGVIESCCNEAAINTRAEQNDVDIASLTLESLLNTENAAAITDIGGIAGTSSGVLRDCRNNGAVGYVHIGYNVGGIAGSQIGFITGCENTAPVAGRKEVGGIVGQMEPDSALDFSEDTLQKVHRQLADLDTMTNTLATDAKAASAALTAQTNTLIDQSEAAVAALESLMHTAQNNVSVSDTNETPLASLLPTFSPTAAGNGLPAARDGKAVLMPLSAPAALAASSDTTAGAAPAATPAPESGEVATPTPEPTASDLPELSIPNITVQNRDSIIAAQNAFSARLRDMLSTLRSMNGTAGSNSALLQKDIAAVSAQMQLIASTLTAAQLPDADETIEDISKADTEKDTSGKVSDCQNSGDVSGDLNIGGIAGAMALENDLDPEDDVSVSGDTSMNMSYRTRVVIRGCSNTGAVSAKKQDAGGIVGLEEMGGVMESFNEGSVTLEGENAGGIAGEAKGLIRACSAKCHIGAARCAGGIAGIAAEVADCRAMIEIDSGSDSLGSIAGRAEELSTLTGNTFVENKWAGVDGISYAGCAEPLSYADFMAQDGLEAAFKTLTLTFTADGETVDTVRCQYGDALAAGDIPAVPEKVGYTGAWPEFDASCITFDETYAAIYTPCGGALESTEMRGSRAMALVDGTFGPGDALTLTALDTERTGLSNALEAWEITIPDNGDATHIVRFLPEAAAADSVLYVQDTFGTWKKAKAALDGSYFTFSAPGGTVRLCVCEKPNLWWAYAAVGAGIALLLLLLVLRARKKHGKGPKPEKHAHARRSKKEKAAVHAEKTAETKAPTGDEKPTDDAAVGAENRAEAPAAHGI